MRTEKLVLCVANEVEEFLNSLEKPLQLNEMRVMKESNYKIFRNILSDFENFGDPILGMMRVHHKQLGLSHKAFDAVYEGLWDLYCKKPQTPDLSAKKLEGFLQRIKLVVPPKELLNEEGQALPNDKDLPVKAIVRIRIPLKRPVKEVINQDQVEQDSLASERQKTIEQREQVQTDRTENYEEMEVEDKVLLVNPIGDTHRVVVFH